MKKLWAAGTMAILLAQTAASQGVIRLKAGNISPSPGNPPLNLAGLDVAWSGPLDPQAKISPVLGTQPAGAYLVIFQPDSTLADDWEFLENQGFTIIQNPDLLPAQL